MLVKNLTAICKLGSRISNPSSLSNLYKSIQLDKNSMNVCSEFGNMEITLTEDTGLTKPCLLEMKSVAACNTLPPNSEIKFTEYDNYLEWRCGNAKGKWNYVIPEKNHTIPQIVHETYPWTPQSDLGIALRLASSACQASRAVRLRCARRWRPGASSTRAACRARGVARPSGQTLRGTLCAGPPRREPGLAARSPGSPPRVGAARRSCGTPQGFEHGGKLDVQHGRNVLRSETLRV